MFYLFGDPFESTCSSTTSIAAPPFSGIFCGSRRLMRISSDQLETSLRSFRAKRKKKYSGISRDVTLKRWNLSKGYSYMCVCVCVCVWIYIDRPGCGYRYIRIHTYIHTYDYIRTYIPTYIRTYVHTYIRTYIEKEDKRKGWIDG